MEGYIKARHKAEVATANAYRKLGLKPLPARKASCSARAAFWRRGGLPEAPWRLRSIAPTCAVAKTSFTARDARKELEFNQKLKIGFYFCECKVLEPRSVCNIET